MVLGERLAGFASFDGLYELVQRNPNRHLFQLVGQLAAFCVVFGYGIALAELVNLLCSGTASADFTTAARCAHKLFA